MTPRAPESNASRPVAWMCAAFAAGALLHVDRVPLWASVVALGACAWRYAAACRPLQLPGKYQRAALAIALLIAVLATFRTLNGLAAGSALLVVMGAVKTLETHRRRDRFIVIGAALFLLLAACLDRQSLLRAPLYLLHVWLCCTALAVTAHPKQGLDDRAAIALAGRCLLYALPLALLLFVTFPRLPGAFWALPRQDEAVTGLSDTMSPGSITQLSESSDPAFRVWFEGDPPPPEERYWRGPVLYDFDGYTWRRRRFVNFVETPLEFEGPAYRYRISLEPHFNYWWFVLDTVKEPPQGPARVRITPDRQLVSAAPVFEPTTYEAVSHTRTRALGPLSTLARRASTALPPNRNPRTLALARSLRERAGSDEAYVEAVLTLFRTGGFEYTLTPPRLDFDSVDDFLFNTRQGFCGHYASAFVTLMRAAGVPARVVTGYLGGEWNPVGGYYIVRQADAHAWSEVWLEGRGWTRVDPTAVVAPDRLRRGIIDLLETGSAPARIIRRTPWLARVSQSWDAVNAWWNTRVIGFDFRTQLDLLGRLGIEATDWRPLGWLLAGGLTAWVLWIGWRLGRSPAPAPVDRLARAYARLCARLARAGAPRAPHQGPLAYAETLCAANPELGARTRPLLERYAELRYGGTAGNEYEMKVTAFERDVARLKVR